MATAAPEAKSSTAVSDLLTGIETLLTADGFIDSGMVDGDDMRGTFQGVMFSLKVTADEKGDASSASSELVWNVVSVEFTAVYGKANSRERLKELLNRKNGALNLLMKQSNLASLKAVSRDYRGTEFEYLTDRVIARMGIAYLVCENLT